MKIRQVVLVSKGLRNHDVLVHLYFFMLHIVEKSNHGLLIGGLSILQPERYDFIGVGSLMHGECHIWFVLFCHFYLVITRETIHERKDYISGDVVHQHIYMQKWKIIF